MSNTTRIEYLKLKRAEYKNLINLEKKENALNQFLTELNNLESGLVKIISLDIDIENIAKPTLFNKPQKTIFTELRFKTIDEELYVQNEIKNWILEQKSDRILIKNEFLIDKTDWLEIKSGLLFRNFDLLFEKLNIVYTLMFSPENGNFINSFEFEHDVTIYKGNLKEKEIKYYS
ncbi:hypothetical protein [Olleya sp. Bg11-27]|uniref:hypothetical protein n=1 Tax=Olleya sp. Bg11-27 TaxID=2058135 RepID=UPI000C3122CB|nr:hypothetical protein [Olleya sp. Bg11-27]AUC75533.1 hypothetical protein CW732_07535 [Olleya sp. Bg11-27]